MSTPAAKSRRIACQFLARTLVNYEEALFGGDAGVLERDWALVEEEDGFRRVQGDAQDEISRLRLTPEIRAQAEATLHNMDEAIRMIPLVMRHPEDRRFVKVDHTITSLQGVVEVVRAHYMDLLIKAIVSGPDETIFQAVYRIGLYLTLLALGYTKTDAIEATKAEIGEQVRVFDQLAGEALSPKTTEVIIDTFVRATRNLPKDQPYISDLDFGREYQAEKAKRGSFGSDRSDSPDDNTTSRLRAAPRHRGL